MKVKKFILKQVYDIKTHGTGELFRKFYLLIKLLGIILADIIAIIPCIIIRLISPWYIIRIERLPALNFGDFIDYTAMYYCKKKLKIDQPTKNYIDLVYIHYKDKVFNKQIAIMWKRKLNFLSGYLLDPISRVNKLITGWKIHTIEILSSKPERDFDNLFEKCQPILEFTNEEEIYGKEILKKFNLTDKDKFVCLSVRDKAYQLKKIPARYRDWSYHNFRNHNIENFLLAAEELTKRGYYIFRMGVVVEKPFDSKNPKIIDYANSKLRSDFMDVYLGAKCSFCITTSSGFQAVPVVFGKYCAVVSHEFALLHLHNKKLLYLTNHYILKKEKRELSLSEIFSTGVAYALDTKIFDQKGIELIENSPEEIKDLVLEAAENVESKTKTTIEDEELQKTFKNLYVENYKFLNHMKYLKRYWKNLKFHGEFRACYSTKFLRENKNWLR